MYTRPAAYLILVVALLAAITALHSTPASALPLIARMDGELTNDQFGIAVSGAGDLNDDGYDDVAVGASASDAGGDASGQVYVFFGAAEPDGTPDLLLPGAAGEFLGAALSRAGDVNDDGFDDLIVGAFRSDVPGEDAGRVYVFFGGDPMDAVADVTLDGPVEGGFFGRAVSGGHDFNGDGFDDVVVGAERVGGGQALVFFGGDPMDAIADLVLDAEGASDRFGGTVVLADDLNGDSEADLFVGAPRNSEVGAWAGKGYVYFGGTVLDDTPDLLLLGEAAGDFFGFSADAGGDLDGDGHTDLAVSAPYYNVVPGDNAGRAYVYLGGPALDTTADATVNGEYTDEELGRGVAIIASLDDDDDCELVVGGPGADTGGEDAGRVLIFHGGEPIAGVPDEEMVGEMAGDAFGYAVADGRDVNRNQLGAVMIGAWEHQSVGAAYLYGDDTSGVGVGDAGMPTPTPSLRIYPNPGAGHVQIEAVGTHAVAAGEAGARVTRLAIYDTTGRLVRRFSDPSAAGASFLRYEWDGRDGAGRRVAAGTYFLRVEGGRLADAGRSWKVIRLR
jgi:hypothetical protein